MKKQFVIASQANISLLLDRFNKYIQRNESRMFEVKQVWGIPRKRETWEGNPVNHRLENTPMISKHPFFGTDKCLMAVRPSSIEDIVNIHYDGVRDSSFYKNYTRDFQIEVDSPYSFIVNEGDKLFFTQEGIIVIPKNNNYPIAKKLSWKLMAN